MDWLVQESDDEAVVDSSPAPEWTFREETELPTPPHTLVVATPATATGKKMGMPPGLYGSHRQRALARASVSIEAPIKRKDFVF